MRLLRILFTLNLCVGLNSLHAVQIALWQTFSDAAQAPRDGQPELLAALELIEQKNPKVNAAAIVDALEIAKSKGHPCAYLLLGAQERDTQKKIELIRYAFDHGLQPAIYGLANALYQHGQGNESDFPEALELFIRANQWPPHKDTQFYIGRMYHLGHGTEQDHTKAREWYTSAVESGSVRAANNLANLWADGDGGEANLPMAMSFLNYASERGMAMASFNLGLKYRTKVANSPDYTNALKYYELAVEQAEKDGWNYAEAAYWVGWIYMYGKGVPVDVDKARHSLEAAAKGKFHRAYFTLGWFWESGQQGVPDLRKANSYYKLAAEQGHAQAMSNLANNLWRLDGVDAMPEALPHFRAAIAKGNADAMTNFGYLNLYKKWPQADPAYGLKITLEAAEKGKQQAIENLFYYYDGWDDLIEPDPKKAAYWKKRMHAK